jgi:type 1 glutamine amidotransferase
VIAGGKEAKAEKERIIMKLSGMLALLVAVVLGFAPAGSAQREQKLLFLTHSAGFKHAVIPLAEKIMPEIGKSLGSFETTVTQDCATISESNLRNYSAVMFYTTGELPITEEGKKALLDFVKSGKGFVGVHSATDTFYKWPEYGEMIGGYFDRHPWHTDVTVRVEDRTFPATAHLGESFRIKDEIYQFTNWSREKTRVLLSLDTNSVDLNAKDVHRTDKDFALAWAHPYGQGRVFYSALGHRDEVWQDERFQKFLVNGVLWAMGVKKSEVKIGNPQPSR